MEATADLVQSKRSAIPAIDRFVVAKSALIFSIVSVEKCVPLRVIRTILDAIPGFDSARQAVKPSYPSAHGCVPLGSG